MKHILLQKALKYKQRKEIEDPKGFSFDSLIGAWINNVDKSLLILSKDFKALGTKKEDVETGEDQKGQ
ncbi:MAG: hypothetical protein ACH34V_07665 [Flavobacterium sp.]|uniref:hypothetical protein n=1 Tax=Flavobacterium sp. TaxID=239 RepID=UPI0037A599AD